MRRVLGTGMVLAVFLLIGYFARPEPSVTTAKEVATPLSAQIAAATTPEYASDSYPVIKVVDGDTLTVNVDGVHTTLRLIGLDTPETVDPRTGVQCFGKEASEKAKQLLSGTSVRLEYDASQDTLDKYGRTLAYIYMEDGTLFNRYMIREGFGHEYTYSTPYKYQADFKAAEAAARAEKKGLWADSACARAAAPAAKPAPSTSGEYECSRNAYNCSDFSSQAAAQAVYDSCGTGDIHRLDSDGDGEVCESLP